MVWESASGGLRYADWPAGDREELDRRAAGDPGLPPLRDPMPNIVADLLADDEDAETLLSDDDAHAYYLASVANSLEAERRHTYPWSMDDLSDDGLAILLDSRSFFTRDTDHGRDGYDVRFVVHAPPRDIVSFLESEKIVGTTRRQTIERLLEWSHRSLFHALYGWEAKTMEDHWQYRGVPPVSRVIHGTTYLGPPGGPSGVQHFTAGCHGTNSFLASMLRAVNIPVVYRTAAGHATPYFPSEGLYLSHGDDPYSRLTWATPPMPMGELLITKAQWESWFGEQVSEEDRLRNISGRTAELAVEHLSDLLLGRRCADAKAGVPHEDGEVYKTLKWHYTLKDLDDLQLWSKLDAKIEAMGGCAAVPKR